MRSRIGKGYVATAILGIAVALLAVSMVAPLISTSADFSIYNSDWNGVSDLAVLTYKAGKFVPTFEVQATGTEISIANLGFEELDLDPTASALVIIGPGKTFSEADGRKVGDFVREGGRLLLADDFGTANTLLESMGATSRFSGQLLMDLAYEKKPEFSVCFDLRPDPVTDGVRTILLNHPSSIVVNSTTTQVIAYSSAASWLDVNENRDQEWGEPRGPFPLLAREHMGTGEIMLLSDPSVLINGMNEYMNNSDLGYNLIAEVSKDRSEVFFDESHRDFFDPVSITMTFASDIPPEWRFIMVVLVFVLALWISTQVLESSLGYLYRSFLAGVMAAAGALGLRFPRRAEPAPASQLDIERIVDQASEKHPEWRAGVLRHILKEGLRHSKAIEARASLKDSPSTVLPREHETTNDTDEDRQPDLQ